MFGLFFWKLPQIWTSNFRKVVRQYTEGMVGSIICVLLEIYFFLAVKEFWKSVKNWQNYCHEFGVLLFLGHRVEAGDGNKRIKLRNWRDTRVYIQDDKKHWPRFRVIMALCCSCHLAHTHTTHTLLTAVNQWSQSKLDRRWKSAGLSCQPRNEWQHVLRTHHDPRVLLLNSLLGSSAQTVHLTAQFTI